MKVLGELWNYRAMIGNLVKKDLKGKYKGSFLGFLWTFINPLFQLLIYSVLFTVIFPSPIKNYSMHLFVALVPWLFCATSINVGSQCIMQSSGLVQKIYFPRITLPIVSVTSNFINMLLAFIIVFAGLLITGIGISYTALMLPIIMILEYFFVMGLVLIFSALTVFFRDLEHILGIVTMAWMYLTPILYSIEQVPEKLMGIMYLNPMTSIIIAYRDILFYNQMPKFETLGMTAVYAVIFLVAGFFIFQKMQKRFAEEL